jgi:hypothetical protein
MFFLVDGHTRPQSKWEGWPVESQSANVARSVILGISKLYQEEGNNYGFNNASGGTYMTTWGSLTISDKAYKVTIVSVMNPYGFLIKSASETYIVAASHLPTLNVDMLSDGQPTNIKPLDFAPKRPQVWKMEPGIFHVITTKSYEDKFYLVSCQSLTRYQKTEPRRACL